MNALHISADLPRQYRYHYEQRLWAGSWRCSYNIVGARGALSLNISGPHVYDGRENWSAGLETHWRAPPDYMRNDPPSQDECHILKCPCWHDGTSLYAQEVYLPMALAGRHEDIFRRMVAEADERFAIVCEGAEAQS